MGSHMPSSEALFPSVEGGCCYAKSLAKDIPYITVPWPDLRERFQGFGNPSFPSPPPYLPPFPSFIK